MQHSDPHISIRISGLQDGEHEYGFRVHARDLELPAPFQDEVRVNLTLEKTRSQYLITGVVETIATQPCDRCLEPVSLELQETILVVFSSNPVRSTDPSLDEDEIRHFEPSAHLLDVTDDVRDALILGIPMRIICGEDEQGRSLCVDPPAGFDDEKEKEPDPRWSGLTSLSQ